MDISSVLEKQVWAVIGAHHKKEKFGYKIFKALQKAGKTVYLVNPGIKEIEGLPCYASVKDIPVSVDVADFVVPASVGVQAVQDCKEAGIDTVWLQPGADKKEVVDAAKEAGLHVICDCVLVQLHEAHE